MLHLNIQTFKFYFNVLLLFLGVLCYELLLQFIWHELVGSKLRVERCTTTSKTGQGERVVAEFLERNLCLQLLIAVLHVHTHDEGTTALQVAHDITGKVGWHIDFKVVDRLQNLRCCILERLAERIACGKHE